ncbi:MAG: hypothetical protein ACREQ9_12215, partial [Candidatus Binatia bacterium]
MVARPLVAGAYDVVLSTQGEYMDAYFANSSGGFAKKVLVHPDDPNRVGRHLNGHVCFFPGNAPSAFQGKFVVADDTYREACVEVFDPQDRCAITDAGDPAYVGTDADGWGVFEQDASWSQVVIAVDDGWSCTPPTSVTSCDANDPTCRCDANGCVKRGHCIQPPGTGDPQGCAFDSNANLIGNDVGSGEAGVNDGVVVMFFASTNYTEHCFLATGLGAPGMPVMDGETLYVPQSGGGAIVKISGPFPQSPSDCANNVPIVPPTIE